MKDRLTLLMCGNASGDFKVKPLLVYRSDNPPVLKQNNVMKSKLPILQLQITYNYLLCGGQIQRLAVLDNFSLSGCIKT